MTSRLIDPRLVVPGLPPLHVPRLRLITALDDARDSPLTLVAAGPGAGKTVLLSEWAHHQDYPVAWITVTPAENEPRRFWRLFLSAVRAASAWDDLPRSVPGGDATVLFESLFSRRPPPQVPLPLVIDDAHLLSHPSLLAGLDDLVRSWHPRLRLVLSARNDPLLPLYRYRLEGRMRELRASDLAMTPSEARALLAAHGVTLPDSAFDVLETRTGGWAAGIRLSAMRMSDTARPADFVAEFAVDQGSIGEYLMNEVLLRQPRRVRRLLIQTGFLDEVTGPLADAITGSNGSATVLADLARANSFVSSLDPAQTRFRYHQLFAEILQHLMRQQAPRLVPTLYRRAAGWYEAQGDVRNAVKWAAHAGDGSGIASLLARGGLARGYVQRHDISDSAAVLDLVEQVPIDGDEARAAEVRTARLALAAMNADTETAARRLGDLGSAPPAIDDPELLVTASLAELILAEKAGDAPLAEATAARLLDVEASSRVGLVPGLRTCILLARARAQYWDGRYEKVDTLLQDARHAADTEHGRAVELEVLGTTALINAYRSRTGRADDAMGQAGELLRLDTDLSAPLTLELAVALRAFVAGDFSAAARAVQRARSSNVLEWDSALAMLLTLTEAQMLLGCGQYSEAWIALSGMPKFDRGEPALLAVQRDMILAAIETGLGRPHGALRLLRRHRSTQFGAPVAVPCARAYLALGDLRNAENCVRRAITGETVQLGRYLLIEAILCDAEIAQMRDNTSRALEMLVRAVEIADGEIILPFVRTTDVFAPLIRRHPTVAARWPVAAAAGEPAAAVAGVRRFAPTPFPEPLTDRELAVLRFLATSMSTAEIADELCVSVNTIKTHLAAIYRKLAARRRREAVLRAREFELL
ncbi:MAG TPA: LuxR C-terminal-related transcriptional regulator [Jatrophihabitantaceae bacterium]|jgi:LuxR family maltose regulon positive regulatory protein